MAQQRKRLSVNLDHVATIRQTRGTLYPVPAHAAGVCELSGADGVTLHLREDRRHIQDRDVEQVRAQSLLPLTLEMALTEEMLTIAERIHPHAVTFVPEKREEQTTERGLVLDELGGRLGAAIERMHRHSIAVTLFLEPEEGELRRTRELGADAVELHTGTYANACESEDRALAEAELVRLHHAARFGSEIGLCINAGHGLTYQNIRPLLAWSELSEFSIGHAIIGRAIFTGLERAVRDMVDLLSGRS